MTTVVKDINREKIDELNEKAFELRHIDREKSAELGENAYKLATTNNYLKGKGNALLNIGFQELVKARYDKAFKIFNEARQIFNDLDDLDGIAHALYNLGIVYQRIGDYNQAMKIQQKSLKINTNISNDLGIARCKNQIGFISTQFGLYDVALKEYSESLKLMDKLNNKAGKAGIFMAMGIAYLDLKKYSIAKKYINDSLSIRTELNEIDAICNSMNYLADVFMKEGNVEEALSLLKKALTIDGKQNHAFTAGTCRLKTNLGKAYTQINDHKNAVYELVGALKLALKTKQVYQLPFIYYELYNVYKSIKDYDKALQYHENFHSSKQKVNSLNAEARLKNLQMQSKVELHEKNEEIHRLKTVELKKRNKIINQERKKSDDLILNILPKKIASELKNRGSVKAMLHSYASVLFIDFVNFTNTTEKLTPEELVNNLDIYFSTFDDIITKYKLEKIKTIGDAYMAAGGVPVAQKDHAINTLNAAFEILEYTQKMDNPLFKIRIGIHSGPVIAGVVGKKKYTYDIWGDTVNIASRMESGGETERINISNNTYKLVKDRFKCMYRGKIHAKHKGEFEMYFVEK